MDTTQEANRPDLSLATPKASVILERYALLAFLVVMLGFAALASPAFLQPANLLNVLTIAAPLGMVVLGQTFALLVRGLDLSVASLMATVAVLATAFRASSNDMIPPIFVAAIVFSALVGLINGWLIAKRGVSPFLATLATMIILQGARFAYTGGAPISTLPPGMADARDRPFPGPAYQPLDACRRGRWCSARCFTNRVSAVRSTWWAAIRRPRSSSAYPRDRVVIACYVICSICAGIGGLFLLGYVGTVSNWVGQGYELDSIVAAVMGGVALSGGRGGVGGALLGVAVLIVVGNLVILLGLPIDVQLIIKGVIIIGAAAIYRTKLV